MKMGVRPRLELGRSRKNRSSVAASNREYFRALAIDSAKDAIKNTYR
jgi:hypothetical protein